MIKLVLSGVWVCAITLAAVFYSVHVATTPAPDPVAEKEKLQKYVAGETINVPIITNDTVSGYFLAKISYMVADEKAASPDLHLKELTTDELFTLLIGNKMIDIANMKNFDLPAFRETVKKDMNTRLGGDIVAEVLVEQLDYLSKDEIRANESAPVKKNLKPVKIVEGTPPPAGATAKAE